MDPYRAFHRRFLNKRQGPIGQIVASLVPASSTAKESASTPAASQNTANPLSIGGVVGQVTSLVGNVPTPSSGSFFTVASSIPLTFLTSSSGSTAHSSSEEMTTPTPSTTSSSSSLATPTSTPPPSSPVSDIVYTTSDGNHVVYVTSTLPAASSTAGPSTSFLQNPSLAGGVFTLVGIVALVIIFTIVTWAIRKRRRDRLERDLAAAVTFDPGATDHYEHSIEKHRLSGSTLDHGHGYGMQLAYAPQQEYHGPVGYGQYPVPAYHAPSIPAHYRPPSPTAPQPVAQGGANLTRKFSDRKPVPPLLPNHAYDPSNAHVSIPPQFYQR